MEEIAKVKPQSWRNMKGLFTALDNTFGVQQVLTGGLKPAQMLQNQATNFLGGALAPLYVGLNNIQRSIERRALENPLPTLIGTGIGFALGFILPGSNMLWAMAGGFIGSLFGPEPVGYSEMNNFLSLFGLELTGPPSDPSGIGEIWDPQGSQHIAETIEMPGLPYTPTQPGGQFGDRLGKMGEFE